MPFQGGASGASGRAVEARLRRAVLARLQALSPAKGAVGLHWAPLQRRSGTVRAPLQRHEGAVSGAVKGAAEGTIKCDAGASRVCAVQESLVRG